MKSLKLSATSFNPSVIPVMNPPTIFPTNCPIPFATLFSNGIPVSTSCSKPGKYSHNNPAAAINAATAAITADITPTPTSADAPVFPTKLRIAAEADNDSNNTDNAAAVPSVCSTGSPAKIYIIPARTVTATVMIIRVLLAPVMNFVDTASTANIPINTDKAAVAPANLLPSIIDKAATDIAITAIAAVNVIIVALTLSARPANFDTRIKAAKHASILTIASIARSSPAGSIFDIVYATRVIATMAPDIARIMTPALAAFSPANLDKAITAPNTRNIFEIAPIALFSEPLLILPICLTA